MRWFAPLASCSPTWRRCICAVLALAYTVTASGVPIFVGKQRHEKVGEPFPCMAGSCGCKTADQCWRSCCCHSLAERLAWARRNGVQPPAFALAQARAVGLDVSTLASHCARCDDATSCCRDDLQVSAPAKPEDSCCTDLRSAAASSTSSDQIVAWRALACRGQSMNWLAAVPQLVFSQPRMSQQMPLISWLGPSSSDVAIGQSRDPAVPPPERA